MKQLIILCLIFNATSLFGQNSQNKDLIEPPVYDTMNIQIQSTNSFYFCNKLYRIPKDCNPKDASSCCTFSTQINKGEISISTGNLSCHDGSTLYWTNSASEKVAKQTFESMPSQMRKQMKKFKHEEVVFFLCNKQVPAYKLTFTTFQGYESSQYIFYGTINGQSIYGQLMLNNKQTSSKNLPPLFQQLVRF